MVYLIHFKDINWKHLQLLKEVSTFSDEDLANWLNISVRSFRDYKKPGSEMKDNIKERVVILLSLVKHGIVSFGSAELFYQWLTTENIYFDGGKPSKYLHTITGIHFIENQLTNMDFGNNA